MAAQGELELVLITNEQKALFAQRVRDNIAEGARSSAAEPLLHNFGRRLAGEAGLLELADFMWHPRGEMSEQAATSYWLGPGRTACCALVDNSAILGIAVSSPNGQYGDPHVINHTVTLWGVNDGAADYIQLAGTLDPAIGWDACEGVALSPVRQAMEKEEARRLEEGEHGFTSYALQAAWAVLGRLGTHNQMNLMHVEQVYPDAAQPV